MKNFFIILMNPVLWTMNKRYSAVCDKFCLEALKNPKFSDIGQYKCQFNGKTIWIGNREPGFEFDDFGVRPARVTVLKIFAALDEHKFKKS